jgi:hypothetical protein
VYCLLIYIGVESFRVTVRNQGASHVDVIKGEARETFRQVIMSQGDDESPLRVTCVTSLVTLPPC